MNGGYSYRILETQDGSHTLEWVEGGVTFHSKHGAIQESRHVFIANGLATAESANNVLSVFEMGFGSGLNALLSWQYAHQAGMTIEYYAVDLHPLPEHLLYQLNHRDLLGIDKPVFDAIVQTRDGRKQIDSRFTLIYHHADIHSYHHHQSYDVVFFDAFGPGTAPKAWEFEVLQSLHQALRKDGMLVTFCAQGAFRRTLKSIGFYVEKLPGPPGKREMTRARKL